MLGLTESAIEKILNIQTGMNQNFVVDVIKLGKSVDDSRTFTIFDGKRKSTGFIQVSGTIKDIHQLFKKMGTQQLRIQIISHIVHKNNLNTYIQILDFQVVNNKLEISEPLQKPKIRQLKLQPVFKSKPNFIKQEYVDKRFSQQAHKNKERYQQDTRQNENNQYKIKNYELINDLYLDSFAWELLVRVIDSKYQQFTSKNGKRTIILAIELIDRVGYTITGKFFGEDAVARRNQIIKGKVYRVSKGKISEDTYITKFSQKQSKYAITFGRVTQFLETKDIPQIPHATTNWLRLSQVPKLPVTDMTFSFVGVIIEIDDEVVMQRQPRPLIFQHIKIGDPITDLIYQCTIWNKQINLDINLLGKSVLLTNVRVGLYKGQKTLATSFRSDLVAHSIFAKFNDNLPHFQILEKKQPRLSTIRQIIQDTAQSSVGGNIHIVEVWVSDIFLSQKWNYDSCPKCKKACQPNSQCLNCSLDIKQPIKRFKIPIELSDQTGALRATAFEQSAPIFLNNTQISDLLKMDIQQLSQFGMKHCFGRYRIQLNSKKDEFGKFSYSINGKPTPINFSDPAAKQSQQAQDMIAGTQRNK